MANLFRLLGLPDPSKVSGASISKKGATVDPGPQAEDVFHYLDEQGWADRTGRMTPEAQRQVVYLKPDTLHRLHTEGMSDVLSGGNMILVDLGSLVHMPSQRDVCRRRVQEMAARLGLPVFAINDDDTLLMVAGAGMRVDTNKHELGIGGMDQLSEL
ncbi:MAG: hypothetical protein CMB22_03850 [Euryarchaeota archaeon]|nr:hypothetical protein [Euryarchaeota archaeon]|tara:strand:+ start:4219 stop:4689 length:471 start_codon:yes stop_codon:yes gene_type:complete